MILHITVSWVEHISTCIANDTTSDAIQRFKFWLWAPKSSTCDNRHFISWSRNQRYFRTHIGGKTRDSRMESFMLTCRC
jgi:hypothetical protein